MLGGKAEYNAVATLVKSNMKALRNGNPLLMVPESTCKCSYHQMLSFCVCDGCLVCWNQVIQTRQFEHLPVLILIKLPFYCWVCCRLFLEKLCFLFLICRVGMMMPYRWDSMLNLLVFIYSFCFKQSKWEKWLCVLVYISYTYIFHIH